jgi:chromosome segregation ATPase
MDKGGCLKSVVDNLSKDRDSLCQELTKYSALITSERLRYKGMLSVLTEANVKLSQDLEEARAQVLQESKVEGDLRQSLEELEAEYLKQEARLKAVYRQLRNKDQNIEQLECEITKEAAEEYSACEALKVSKKENIQLRNQLRTLQANYEATEGSLEDLRTQLADSYKELREVKKDLGRSADEVQCLMEELEGSRETSRALKDKIKQLKQDCSRQASDRFNASSIEKRELEHRLSEIQEETQDTKYLFENSSLQDELDQLVDFQPARVSSLFNSFHDTQKHESAELAEMQSLIESLTSSKEELQDNLNKVNKHLFKVMRQLSSFEEAKEAEINRYRLLIQELQTKQDNPSELQIRVVELMAEVDRLNKELSVIKHEHSDELQRLTQSLRDSEFKAAEVRLKYHEVAKNFSDLKQQVDAGSLSKGGSGRLSLSNIFKRA